jgi:hypothetical protein
LHANAALDLLQRRAHGRDAVVDPDLPGQVQKHRPRIHHGVDVAGDQAEQGGLGVSVDHQLEVVPVPHEPLADVELDHADLAAPELVRGSYAQGVVAHEDRDHEGLDRRGEGVPGRALGRDAAVRDQVDAPVVHRLADLGEAVHDPVAHPQAGPGRNLVHDVDGKAGRIAAVIETVLRRPQLWHAGDDLPRFPGRAVARARRANHGRQQQATRQEPLDPPCSRDPGNRA